MCHKTKPNQSSLFNLAAYLRLRLMSISYMPGSIDFSRLNLFRISYHHLTFSILCKWYICFVYRPNFCTVQCIFSFYEIFITPDSLLQPSKKAWKHFPSVYLVLHLVCCQQWSINIWICLLELVIPGSSSVCLGQQHNLCFLEVTFQPKYVCSFLETGDYFLCLILVVFPEDSVVSIHKLT